MVYDVTLVYGDGTGPEITEATKRVLEATGVQFRWDFAVAGEGALDKFGTPLPDSTLESIKKNKVALKGPITTPVGQGFRSVNVALRQNLELYACLRPCKIYPGVPTRYEEVDIVVVRENTEDLYAGIEFDKRDPVTAEIISKISKITPYQLRDDSSFSLKIASVMGTGRIAKFAFEYARSHGRKKVTIVHKANILKASDGLFLNVGRDVAKEYPDIECDDVIVDALCMRLVRNPELYDILLLPNLYGDFVSDLCAGLVGGLGVAPGANIGDDIAIFEATHGSAPKYTGQNKVNPMAMMLSGMMMLRHLDELDAADRLEAAIAAVIAEGKIVTYDLKPDPNPPVGTSQVTEAVIEKLKGGDYAQ
jgi:isocitrate dehydrogenase (NAD+)